MPEVGFLRLHGGGNDGMEAFQQGMGRRGQLAVLHHGGRCLSQRDDHTDERGGLLQTCDRSRSGLQRRDRRQHTQSLSTARPARADSRKAFGSALARHARVPRSAAGRRPNATPRTWLRFQRVVVAQVVRPSGEADRHPFQRRPVGADHASGEVLVSASQTHDEREAGRGSLPTGCWQAAHAQKKAVRDDADEALIFQDEMEIHRHPALARMWAPVGQQLEVPAPGQNEKKVVYGGVDYRTGELTYTVADSKCGGSFLAFLAALLLAYAGKKIRLVCDNGRFHTTKAVQAFLEEHREQIEVYWLPPYCPSLNLIERLWGHLKRTVLANVLYATLSELVAAFRKGARRLTGDRERMGFMFDHDDVMQKSSRAPCEIAA